MRHRVHTRSVEEDQQRARNWRGRDHSSPSARELDWGGKFGWRHRWRISSLFSFLARPIRSLSSPSSWRRSDNGTSQATVWRIPSLASSASAAASSDPSASPSSSPSSANPTLHRLFDLTGHTGRVRSVVWNATSVDQDAPDQQQQQQGQFAGNSLLTLDQQCMRVWELNEAATELKVGGEG